MTETVLTVGRLTPSQEKAVALLLFCQSGHFIKVPTAVLDRLPKTWGIPHNSFRVGTFHEVTVTQIGKKENKHLRLTSSRHPRVFDLKDVQFSTKRK